MRCLVQPERRSPLASVFHSFLTGADTEPRGRSAPVAFRGAAAADAWAPHPAPSPTSHKRAGATAAAHGLKDPEELAEASGRALQGAGRRRIPEHERRGRRARPAAAVGRLETAERRSSRARAGAGAAAAGVGAGGWEQSRGGTDARGARPGSRGRPGWPSPPCSRRVVFWLPRLLNASRAPGSKARYCALCLFSGQ